MSYNEYMNLVGTRSLDFCSGLGVARHDGSFLFIFITLSSGADGHVSRTVDYDIFGKPVTETGVFVGSAGGSGGISALVFAYAGKPYDPVTGLSDYGFRDYAPTLARFTTIDPIRDGSNWYAYCNSDPVNYVDLWGLDAYTPFNTVAEAVDDFSICFNDDSIKRKIEIGATIYESKDSNGKQYYYYPLPNDGTERDVEFYTPANKTSDVDVAIIHTHGHFIDEKGEGLSNQDIKTGEDFGVDVYVVTPGGLIQGSVKNSSGGYDIENRVNVNVASDPNPNAGAYRLTKVDPNDLPDNTTRTPTNLSPDEILKIKEERIKMYGKKEVGGNTKIKNK